MKLVIEIDLDGSMDNSANFHQEIVPFVEATLQHLPDAPEVHLTDALDANPNGDLNGTKYVLIGGMHEADPNDHSKAVRIAQMLIVDAPFVTAPQVTGTKTTTSEHTAAVIKV